MCPVQRPRRGLSVFGAPRLSLQNKQQKSQKGWKNSRKNTTFRLTIWNERELHTYWESFAENQEDNDDKTSKWKFVETLKL